VHRDAYVVEYAEPVGVVMAICPVTNPTSTPIFKALSAAKGRNATVIAPHPRAVHCAVEVAELLSGAARAAGGPENLVTCLAPTSIAAAQELMAHPLVALILATGGAAMVQAAYRSGRPALGVGPGNVPVYVDASCRDVDAAVAGMLRSKTMDYGTSCSAEQCLVVHSDVAATYRESLRQHGARFLDAAEAARLARECVDESGAVRPAAVGQSAATLAERAAIDVDPSVQLLVVEIDGVGRDVPFSAEILTSAIAYHEVAGADAGFSFCSRILAYGGLGHTAVVWADDPTVIERFAPLRAGRVLVNLPGTWGTSGMLTNVDPSFSIGTGPWGGSAASDNITFRHTLQRRRLLREAIPAEVFLARLEAGPETATPMPAPAASRSHGAGAVTAGLNAAPATYAAVPLSPEEEEIVEASVSEVLRHIGATAGARR
jgi:acetaldehyde dehydrogenase (acetylating)